MSNICVVGSGYVGLITGACLAELGHTVVCVELDSERYDSLKRGQLPIHEPGLSDLVDRHRRTGRVLFTDDYSVAFPQAEFAFIAVNTPSSENGQLDSSFVFGAVRSIMEDARSGLIIVTKSTVPVGTCDAIAQLTHSSGSMEVAVVSNPEFLRLGSGVQDFLEPDRIVIGADPEPRAAVARLYAALDAPVILCSRRSAELAKYAANIFLAARVSLVNELSAICEAVRADIDEVTKIVGSDPRIGPAFLKAGLGWGGSCFPKDVLALRVEADNNDCDAPLLAAILEVNTAQRTRAFERLWMAVRDVPHPTVGILGLAFKPETDDVRAAPALEIIARLLGEGALVRAHDPVAITNARHILPGVQYCSDAYDVATGCDAILLATEWPEYLSLDWRRIRSRMRGRVVLDGRNALDAAALSALGFDYKAFGRSAAASESSYYLEPVANVGGS